MAVYHEIWWRVFRPVLLGKTPDLGDVWIGRGGTRLSTGQLFCQVRARTGAPRPTGLDRPLGIHIIRTLYATSMADRAATDRRLLALTPWMLDHRSARSIDAYNLIADSVAAAATLELSMTELPFRAPVVAERRPRHRPL